MSPLDGLKTVLSGYEDFVLVYLVLLNASYVLLLGLGWGEISSFVRRRRLRDYEIIAARR